MEIGRFKIYFLQVRQQRLIN